LPNLEHRLAEHLVGGEVDGERRRAGVVDAEQLEQAGDVAAGEALAEVESEGRSGALDSGDERGDVAAERHAGEGDPLAAEGGFGLADLEETALGREPVPRLAVLGRVVADDRDPHSPPHSSTRL
jgi:hypothetical protein